MGSVIILEKGKPVYKRHFNFKPEPKKPLYRLGSISKVYTATIVLKLIENERLNLDTKLSKFYPHIDGSEKITIEYLLRHHSGIPNFTNDKEYTNYFEGKITEEEQIKRFKKYKLEFDPGNKYNYSNSGYLLLTYIIQKVSGLPYGDLLKKYISTPLQLDSTFVYDKNNPIKSEVKSYKRELKWKEASNSHQSVPGGAGAIVSTPLETAKFLRELLRGKIIGGALLEKMKIQVDGYGLGLFTFPYDDKKAFGHTGSIDGFRSIAGYFIEDDIVMVQLTNALATNFNDISIAILNSHYGKEIEFPKFIKPVHVDETLLKNYVGIYSDKSFPLKLTFFVKNGHLFGQATGQSAIPFEALSPSEFRFPSANIKLTFSKKGQVLEFSQGKTFMLKKE